jgi:hypothetical protein
MGMSCGLLSDSSNDFDTNSGEFRTQRQVFLPSIKPQIHKHFNDI